MIDSRLAPVCALPISNCPVETAWIAAIEP